jgi:hypothetical protein
MKLVVNSLFASLPPLGNVLLVCLLFYLIFGIMAVDLLAVRVGRRELVVGQPVAQPLLALYIWCGEAAIT